MRKRRKRINPNSGNYLMEECVTAKVDYLERQAKIIDILKTTSEKSPLTSTEVIDLYCQQTNAQKDKKLIKYIRRFLHNLCDASNNKIARKHIDPQKRKTNNTPIYHYYFDRDKGIKNTGEKRKNNFFETSKIENISQKKEDSSLVEYNKQDIQFLFGRMIGRIKDQASKELLFTTLNQLLGSLNNIRINNIECEKLTENFFDDALSKKNFGDKLKASMLSFFKQGELLLSIEQDIEYIQKEFSH